MIQSIEAGGLKLPDLETRTQTNHLRLVQQMWTRPHSLWTFILAEALETGNIKYTLLSKTNLADRLLKQYPLFKQVLETWARYHLYTPLDETEVQEVPLWDNRQIIIGGEPVVWESWLEAGINCINDLMHQRSAV